MKEIWINSELYIKSYEFSIFRDFFWIFSEFISILNNKNELKNDKSFLFFARVPHGCDVALRATWQRHAGPRGAYAAYRYIYHYLYSI